MGCYPHRTGPDPLISAYSPQRDVLTRDLWLIWLLSADASWLFLLQNYVRTCPKRTDHSPSVVPMHIHLKSHYLHLLILAKTMDHAPKGVNTE